MSIITTLKLMLAAEYKETPERMAAVDSMALACPEPIPDWLKPVQTRKQESSRWLADGSSSSTSLFKPVQTNMLITGSVRC